MSFPEEPMLPAGMGSAELGLDPMAPEIEEPEPPGRLFEGPLHQGVDYSVPSFKGAGASAQDRRNRLGRRVCEEVDAWKQHVEGRLDDAQDWRRDFEGMESDAPLPWPGAAATRASLVPIACQAHAQKLNTLVFGSSPAFTGKARKRSALAFTPIVEDVIEATLEAANWQDPGRQVHQGLTIDGNCLLRVTHEIRTERIRRIKIESDDAAADALAEAGASPAEALQGSLKTDRTGRPKPFLEAEDVTISDGVSLRYIPFRRAVMLPCTAEDVSDLWALGEVVRIRGIDLREGAKSGKYIESEVDEILKSFGDAKDSDDDEEQNEIQGTERADGQQVNALFREYECVELCLHDCLEIDPDESATVTDAVMEWYVVTVHLRTQRVLRVSYSPYEHGRAYYVPFRYLMRDGSLLYASVAERANQLQAIATFLFNSIIDLISVLKGTSTSFVYDWTAGLKPGNLQWRPGMPWGPLKNVNGIKDLPVGNQIPAAITACVNLLGIVKEWFDLLTGASNTVMGRVEPGQQTAFEINKLFGESAAIFQDHSRGVALAWAQVADLVRWITKQYAPGGEVEYRVEAGPEQLMPDPQGQPQRFVFQSERLETGILGPPQQVPMDGPVGFGRVPADVLGADIDILPAGISQLPDRQARLQRDLLINDLAIKHPVIGQMRTVLAELFKTVLESGQAPNRERLLQMIDAELQRIQMMEEMALAAQQLDAAGAMGAAAQEGERAAGADQREQESHQLGMQERAVALAAGPQGAKPGANGAKK